MKYFRDVKVIDGVKSTQYYQPEGAVMCIPEAEDNMDYAKILEEVEAGTSTIEEVDATE